MTPAEDPSTPSLAHKTLAPMWAMINAILAGAQAVKAAGETYLPKFPAESPDEYTRRKNSAPWRPEFEDAIRSIASKPFTDEVTLAGDPSSEMKDLAEDIDGRGNNLHVFARDMFEGGISLGAHGILVDFPTMAPNATKADEKAAGARPYWVSVDADEIIALRTTRIGAREIVTHLRLKETKTVINGFEEATEDRIRVIEPGKWEIWKPIKNAAGQIEWVIEDAGLLTLPEVPFVFYATAERCGPQYVRPPMLDVANMQIELYQQMSGEEQIYTMAGAPMLTANGMAAPADGGKIEVGPGRVLYAPGAEGISTSWAYVEPTAANLAQVSARVRSTIEDIKRLGLQPTLPKTGNVTATASGIDAAKGHNAVETWANALKDALEQAFVFTAMWLKSTEEVKINVHTDFAIGMYGAQELTALTDMRAAGDLSQESLWDEMTRRGVLGPQFDKDEEEERLLGEIGPDADAEDLTDALPPGNKAPPVDPNNPSPPGA